MSEYMRQVREMEEAKKNDAAIHDIVTRAREIEDKYVMPIVHAFLSIVKGLTIICVRMC